MELSIITVNYKVKDLLERCLASIYRETHGVSFEVFVVDNDSRDGSIEMLREKFPQAQLIANERNVGFAAANNQAMREAKGEFMIWLNPDCELRDDALSAMVHWMRQNPQAAIAGPRLVYEDGRPQPSVRRFPTLSDQAIILTKLHHIFPKWRPLTRYLATDFSYDAAAPVDQVMGAVFMVRRPIYERLGGMDERYFLWFEEVDYCKTAKDAGLEVWYTPAATIVHRGGQSFNQVFAPKKQRMLNESMRKYFLKHFGVPATAPLYVLQPFSLFLAWLVSLVRGAPATASAADRFQSDFQRAVVGYAVFELLAYAAYFFPTLEAAFFLAVVAVVALLALKRPDLAALAVLAELFTGSQGGAQLAIGGASGLALPLRIGVFLAFFAVWAAKFAAAAIRGGWRTAWDSAFGGMHRADLLLPYAAVLGALAIGGVRGLWFGNGFSNVFFDGNAYLFLATVPPLIAGLRERRTRLMAAAIACAAATVNIAKALVIHYFFSHRLQHVMVPLYLWIRDTRVGEITRMVGDFYRVFFQSEFFLLPVGFCALVAYAYFGRARAGMPKFWLTMTWVSLTGLIMSLSRSFWFGVVLAGVFLTAILARSAAVAITWKRAAAAVGSGVLVAVIALAAIYAIPFPRKGAAFSLADLLKRRALAFSDEAAANSRWALLPKLEEGIHEHPLLGSGLGRTVTYTTSDPRLLADNPTGAYTTYAFEWGYHDMLLKFGVIGFIAFAWFIGRVLAPIWRRVVAAKALLHAPLAIKATAEEKTAVIAAGLLCGAVAVLATNVFSPYLNHPLGIGFLALLAAFSIYECEDFTGEGNTAPMKSR